MNLSSTKLTVILLASVALSIALGVIIGHFSMSKTTLTDTQKLQLDYYARLIRDDSGVEFLNEILAEANAEIIKKNLELSEIEFLIHTLTSKQFWVCVWV